MKFLFVFLFLSFSNLVAAQDFSIINLKWDGYSRTAYLDVVTSSSIENKDIYATIRRIDKKNDLSLIELTHSNEEEVLEDGASLRCIKIVVPMSNNKQIILPSVSEDIWGYSEPGGYRCSDYIEVNIKN